MVLRITYLFPFPALFSQFFMVLGQICPRINLKMLAPLVILDLSCILRTSLFFFCGFRRISHLNAMSWLFGMIIYPLIYKLSHFHYITSLSFCQPFQAAPIFYHSQTKNNSLQSQPLIVLHFSLIFVDFISIIFYISLILYYIYVILII